MDDGTGVVVVMKWLNNYNGSVLNEHDIDAKTSIFHIGDLVTVLGKLTTYKGECEITAERACRSTVIYLAPDSFLSTKSAVVERDPNSETLHWIKSVELFEKVYSKPCPIQAEVQHLIAKQQMEAVASVKVNNPPPLTVMNGMFAGFENKK